MMIEVDRQTDGLDKEDIVSVTVYSGHLIIATQTRVFKLINDDMVKQIFELKE